MQESLRSTPNLLNEIARGLQVQARVVGALLMRELHTRYGRENVGYLWIFLEPMSLAAAVALLHAEGGGNRFGSDIRPVPFAICGYTMFIMFRGMVTRAESALEANMPLFYHRTVSTFDIFFSRALLEGASTFVSYLVLIILSASFGWANIPYRPFEMIAAFILMFWLSFSMSMIVGGMTFENRLAGRLVHPIVYILMPLSGAFYRMNWVPDPYRHWLAWWPMVQIFELLRYGQFKSATDTYIWPAYISFVCVVLTYIGMMWIRITRRHIHLR